MDATLGSEEQAIRMLDEALEARRGVLERLNEAVRQQNEAKERVTSLQGQYTTLEARVVACREAVRQWYVIGSAPIPNTHAFAISTLPNGVSLKPVPILVSKPVAPKAATEPPRRMSPMRAFVSADRARGKFRAIVEATYGKHEMRKTADRDTEADAWLAMPSLRIAMQDQIDALKAEIVDKPSRRRYARTKAPAVSRPADLSDAARRNRSDVNMAWVRACRDAKIAALAAGVPYVQPPRPEPQLEEVQASFPVIVETSQDA